MGKKKGCFIDIDGTLARFHDADKMFIEAMWTPGFYIGLKPFESLVEAVRLFKERNPDVEVFTLSAVLDTDPPFVIGEKNAWLDKYLPFIDREHRIFTDAGEDKSEYIDMDAFDCTLLDDYNKNLYEFELAGGHAIKFHNDVNHRGLGEFGGSKGNLWTGDIVHHYDSPEKICRDLEVLILGKSKEEIENVITSYPDKNPDFLIEDDVLVEYLGHERTVVIPEGIREIGINAFWNNRELKQVVFPESLEKIGNGAFAGVDLQQLILPKNLKEIGRNAFEGCNSLEFVRIPAGVFSMSQQAFDDCKNLQRIEVDGENQRFFNQDGMVCMRNMVQPDMPYLFRCPTGIKGKLALENDVAIVAPNAFMSCDGITEVTLPDTVRILQDGAFNYCWYLEHIDLPKGLAQLHDSVFMGCRHLRSISIPDGIDFMGNRIFDGCHSLEEIVISDEALVDYCKHYNFLDEVFMLPCYEELAVRYEALMNKEASRGGVDEILADAADRAGKSECKSNSKEFEV